MPEWASILVPVLVAAFSGAGGVLVASRSRRRERFRDRLIDAADDFAAAGAEALIKMRDAIREVAMANDAERMKNATEAAWQHHDISLHRSARIDLLFGPTSGAAQSANDTLKNLAEAASALLPPALDAEAADRAHVRSADALREFHLAVLDAIRYADPPTASLYERARRQLHGG